MRGVPKDEAISVVRVVVAALAALTSAPAWAGPAINQFEVKDLESSPGDFEFQSQNAFSTGQPSRRSFEKAPGDVVYDDNTVTRQRESLEVQLGVTDWLRFRVGIEYEQERLDDPENFNQANSFGALKIDEVSLETVIVFVKPKAEGVGFGWLFEYGDNSSGGVEGRDELFTGPIVEAHTGPWSFLANLALVKYFHGRAAADDPDYVVDHKLDFAYFLQGGYRFSESWQFALESYGAIDRLGSTGHRPEADQIFGDFNQHRAGPVVYYTMFPFGRATENKGNGGAKGLGDGEAGEGDAKEWSMTIGGGALFGLNENTPDTTYKLSVELDY